MRGGQGANGGGPSGQDAPGMPTKRPKIVRNRVGGSNHGLARRTLPIDSNAHDQRGGGRQGGRD